MKKKKKIGIGIVSLPFIGWAIGTGYIICWWAPIIMILGISLVAGIMFLGMKMVMDD